MTRLALIAAAALSLALLAPVGAGADPIYGGPITFTARDAQALPIMERHQTAFFVTDGMTSISITPSGTWGPLVVDHRPTFTKGTGSVMPPVAVDPLPSLLPIGFDTEAPIDNPAQAVIEYQWEFDAEDDFPVFDAPQREFEITIPARGIILEPDPSDPNAPAQSIRIASANVTFFNHDLYASFVFPFLGIPAGAQIASWEASNLPAVLTLIGDTDAGGNPVAEPGAAALLALGAAAIGRRSRRR